MSKQTAQLIEAIRNICWEEPTIIPATVETLDEENGTISVITFEGMIIPEVRVRAVIEEDDKGMLVFPAEGTSVLIARIIKSDNYVLIALEEPEIVKCRIGEKYLELDKDGLELSAGEDTLKKCLDDLLDEIITIYAPMNKAAFTAIKDRLAKLLK